jgi:alkylation response protein AidB-like acyl-CoA dehydrogenase
MKLHYDAATEAFRAELRAWLDANRPSAEAIAGEPSISSAHIPGWARAWQQALFDSGWLVPGWPPELGGRNATPVQQLVYFEEMARIPVQRTYNPQGLTIIVPSLRDFGSDAQKDRFLVPSLRAEVSWCLGMSEPGAGSDLAGLQTRAEVRADGFVVNGQKVWTSGAAQADWCFCFVRTNADTPKHRGISVLLVDMKSPGVEVRPMPELTDRERADFSEVFFDGVVVPRACLVGEVDAGWAMAAGSLAHERGMLWTSQAARLEHLVHDLCALARERGLTGDPVFRDRLAALHVDAQALKFMGYRGFGRFARGEASQEHSVLKLLGSEIEQRLALEAVEALGTEALDVAFAGPGMAAEEGAPWARRYLFSFANTIAGGTSEIQRNIIAQRVLGLPRR